MTFLKKKTSVQYVALFPDNFCKNRNILLENNANELKFAHKPASASGTLAVKFHCLKLFGFFVILERFRPVGCPVSRQVALFPDDRYEINTPFFLGNIFLDNGKIHIIKVKLINIHSKNPFCLKFNAFSYNFSDKFIGVLKRLNKLNKQRNTSIIGSTEFS